MFFVYPDFYETENFQYLKIPKNASNTVVKIIEETMNYSTVTEKNSNKIKWTVIRDPYERFMSGLQYDLNRCNINLDEINLEECFNANWINPANGLKGSINHSSSQVPYLINTEIDYYIDIKDLDIFLKINFGKTLNLNKNTNKKELNLKKELVMKYLNLDYSIYNFILTSPFLWKWQQGKIF
jgi:hypothetical protein